MQFYKANEIYVYQPVLKNHLFDDSEIKHLKNDLGIVYVERPIEFSERVGPACMPKTKIAFGSTCYASGWGNTEDYGFFWGSEKPDYLMTAPLNIFNKSQCFMEALKQNENVTYEMFEILYELIPGGICASNRPKSTCRGDSGGPLICEENGKAVIHGIVSGGFDVNFGLFLEL